MQTRLLLQFTLPKAALEKHTQAFLRSGREKQDTVL